jgi:hypothetical protein
MTTQPLSELNISEIDPEEKGVKYWYKRYYGQLYETKLLKQRVKELKGQFESLNEKLIKLRERTSEMSPKLPSSDGPKKPSRDKQKPQRKRSPKYNQLGKTRDGYSWVDHVRVLVLAVPICPICGGTIDLQHEGTNQQQVAELVPVLIEVWEKAELGLQPVVIHCKVTVGSHSNCRAQLVAITFSFLESMRRQAKNVGGKMFHTITSSGCSPLHLYLDSPISLKSFSLNLFYRGSR